MSQQSRSAVPSPSPSRGPAPSMLTRHGANGGDFSSNSATFGSPSSRGHRRAQSMAETSTPSSSIPFAPSSSASATAALLLDGASSPVSASPPSSASPPVGESRSLDTIPGINSRPHSVLTSTRSADSTTPMASPSHNGSLTPQPPSRQPQRMVEVSLEQVSDHQFLSLLKMKFKKTRRLELELKELQRLFVLEEEERRRLAEENSVLTRRLEEERRLREAADSLASALRDDNGRLNAQIEELNLRLVEIITNVSHMGVPPAEKARVFKKATKQDQP